MAWTITMLAERDGVIQHPCRASGLPDASPDATIVGAVAAMMVEWLEKDHSGESAAMEASNEAIARRA